jgi:hypothetical protein
VRDVVYVLCPERRKKQNKKGSREEEINKIERNEKSEK